MLRITERFSVECCKTKTKAITPTNHKQCKQHKEGGKRGKKRASEVRLVLVCFSLVEKVARILVTNRTAQKSKANVLYTVQLTPREKAIKGQLLIYLRVSIVQI